LKVSGLTVHSRWPLNAASEEESVQAPKEEGRDMRDDLKSALQHHLLGGKEQGLRTPNLRGAWP
jgi:hypothetical protein